MKARPENSEKAVLCWLATVDSKNRPNVSPKEIYADIGGDRLLIADIASARSVRNIKENPAVCVSMIDVFLQRGQKLEGTAEIIASDHPDFPAVAAPLLDMVGSDFTIRNVISIQIEHRSRIVAPSYVFHPERSEAELQSNAYRTYGVRPLFESAGQLASLVPMLQCDDVKATIEWYQAVLGFRCVAESEGTWCRLEREGAAIMFMKNARMGAPQATATQYIYAQDVLGLWNTIKHICKAEWGPEVMPYGMLEFAIRDLNGYLLSFGQPAP